MNLRVAAALLALFTSTSAFAAEFHPVVSTVPHTVPGLTAAQKAVIVNAAFNQTLLILDRLGRMPTEAQRNVLFDAVGQAFEHIITRNDMLGLDGADGARQVLEDGVKAAIAASAAVVAGDKVGSSAMGGGLGVGVDVILGSVTTDVIAAGASVVGALAAGVAIGFAIDDTYSTATGRSIGEDIAAGVEAVSQRELDAAVEAAQAAHEEAEQEKAEREKADAEAKPQGDNNSNPPATGGSDPPAGSSTGSSGGTPNPDNDNGDGGRTGPITGGPDPVGAPGSGNSEAARWALNFKQDLAAILAHGKMPLILTTPEMLNRLHNLPGALP